MPGTRLVIEHVHIMRWQRPSAGDIDDLVQRFRAIEEAQGRKAIHIGVQGDDYVEPDRFSTTVLRRRFEEMMAPLAANYIVVLPGGMTGMLQRASLRAMVAAGRVARFASVERVHVVSRLETVIKRERARLPATPEELMARCRDAGIV